jgi:hypothetical protein
MVFTTAFVSLRSLTDLIPHAVASSAWHSSTIGPFRPVVNAMSSMGYGSAAESTPRGMERPGEAVVILQAEQTIRQP